jgi:hypothetical protein
MMQDFDRDDIGAIKVRKNTPANPPGHRRPSRCTADLRFSSFSPPDFPFASALHKPFQVVAGYAALMMEKGVHRIERCHERTYPIGRF